MQYIRYLSLTGLALMASLPLLSQSISSGTVTGTARAIHIGRSTQVWEIRIETETGELVCISRITMAVIPSRAVSPR